MSLSDLASLGSFISGLAVLASLIFVGVQIRQNARAVQASTSLGHTSAYNQLVSPVISQADFARVWRIGLADPNALNDDERLRFIVYCSTMFRLFEAQRLQWQLKQLSTVHWNFIDAQLRGFIGHPGIKMFWKLRRQTHSDDFAEWVDSVGKDASPSAMYNPELIGRQGS
jgi:hypothetical protein